MAETTKGNCQFVLNEEGFGNDLSSLAQAVEGSYKKPIIDTESEQAPLCSFGLTKTLNFMLFYENYLIIQKLFVSLPPRTKRLRL